MKVGKRDFNVFAAAIKAKRPKVRLNNAWSKVHNEWGIGHLLADGNSLQLTRSEYQKLRQLVKQATGADPLVDQLPELADRVEAAVLARDEKWAGAASEAGYALVTSHSGCIEVGSERLTLPQRTSLSVELDRLNVSEPRPVVVVENLAAFQNWSRFRLPSELKQALVVYRGHDASEATVLAWFKAVPALQRVGFFDFLISPLSQLFPHLWERQNA